MRRALSRFVPAMAVLFLHGLTGGGTATLAAPKKPSPPKKKRIQVEAPEEDSGSTEDSKKAAKGRRGRKKAAAARKLGPDLWPPMQLEQVNTHEKLSFRLYDRKGAIAKNNPKKLWHFFRCVASKQERPIHWHLLRNLYRVYRHFGQKKIRVYSAYRSLGVAELKTSNHTKGRAIDFTVEGVANRSLRDYLMHNFSPAGVGYYPRSPFVHFDVREGKSAFWVDFSGKGEDSRYAQNPLEVVRLEKKGVKPESIAQKLAPKPKPAADPSTGVKTSDEPDEAIDEEDAPPKAKPTEPTQEGGKKGGSSTEARAGSPKGTPRKAKPEHKPAKSVEEGDKPRQEEPSEQASSEQPDPRSPRRDAAAEAARGVQLRTRALHRPAPTEPPPPAPDEPTATGPVP
jgi:uncharacterized protein YcbK (DUF882 family)